jgi:hypothetical protein
MASDLFDGLDEGVKLERPMAPMPMARSFMDFRREHGSLRIGLRGEDGSLDDWTALMRTVGWDRLSAAYKALKGKGPVWYGSILVYLEEENARAINAAIAPVRDWRPVLLDFMRTPKPTAAQAAAIAYLRKLAKDRGVKSLDLRKVIEGVRVELPEPADGTIAAVLGKDPEIIARLQKAKFI